MIETNKAQLIGFLGSEPERKENGNGNSYLVLSVATNTSWKKPNSEEWESRTEWHRVVVWGKQAARLNLKQRRQGTGCRGDSLPRIRGRSLQEQNQDRGQETLG